MNDDFTHSCTMFYENIQVRERVKFLSIEKFSFYSSREVEKFYILCKLQGTSVDILAKGLKVSEGTSSSGFPGKVLNRPSIPIHDQTIECSID